MTARSVSSEARGRCPVLHLHDDRVVRSDFSSVSASSIFLRRRLIGEGRPAHALHGLDWRMEVPPSDSPRSIGEFGIAFLLQAVVTRDAVRKDRPQLV